MDNEIHFLPQGLRERITSRMANPDLVARVFAWYRLPVFALGPRWFIVLFVFVVIGHCNCFGSGWTAVKWRPLYTYGDKNWYEDFCANYSCAFILRHRVKLSNYLSLKCLWHVFLFVYAMSILIMLALCLSLITSQPGNVKIVQNEAIPTNKTFQFWLEGT